MRSFKKFLTVLFLGCCALAVSACDADKAGNSSTTNQSNAHSAESMESSSELENDFSSDEEESSFEDEASSEEISAPEVSSSEEVSVPEEESSSEAPEDSSSEEVIEPEASSSEEISSPEVSSSEEVSVPEEESSSETPEESSSEEVIEPEASSSEEISCPEASSSEEMSSPETSSSEEPHEHDYQESVIEPNCTQQGYTTYACGCGDTYTDNYVAAGGHHYEVESCVHDPSDDTCLVTLACTCGTKTEATALVAYSIAATCKDGGYGIYEYAYDNGIGEEFVGEIQGWTSEKTSLHTLTDGTVAVFVKQGAQLYYNDDIGALISSQVIYSMMGGEANCQSSCMMFGECGVCEDTITFDLYGAHNYEDGEVQFDEVGHWKTCGDCGFGNKEDNFEKHYGGTATSTQKAKCKGCGQEYGDVLASQGLNYTLSNDKTYYSVSGIGTCSDRNLIIPSKYNDLPVKAIDDYAFYERTELTSVEIREGITKIGKFAFSKCTNLTSLKTPDSITGIMSVGLGAFSYCSSLKELTCSTAVLDRMEESTENLETVIVTSGDAVLDNAFDWCKKLTSVEIGEGVTVIGWQAFMSCTALKTVKLPESLTMIGEFAFSGCTNLTDVNMPESLVTISGVAFENCSSLTNITFGDKLESIGYGAFGLCSKLETVTFGKNLTEIGYSAFSGCASLKSVQIPDKVKTLQYETFMNCTSLTEVVLNNGVTEIGNGCFSGCTNLTKVCLSDEIAVIGENAFLNCNNLEYTVEEELKYLGSENNPYLYLVGTASTAITTAKIHAGCKIIGAGALLNCSKLTNLEIPNSVTTIGDYAFSECDGLTEVIIPAGVTSLGSEAFRGCNNLTSVIIPKSVASIGVWAFAWCSKATVYCEAESQPSGWDNEWNYTDCPVVWGYKAV